MHTGKHHDPFLLVPILIIGLTLAGSGVGKHWRAECFSLVFVLLLFLLMNIDEPMATVPGLIVWIPGLTLLGAVKLPKPSHSTSLGPSWFMFHQSLGLAGTVLKIDCDPSCLGHFFPAWTSQEPKAWHQIGPCQ